MSRDQIFIELLIGITCALLSVWLLLEAKKVIGTDDSPLYAAGFVTTTMVAAMCILDFVSYLKHNNDK